LNKAGEHGGFRNSQDHQSVQQGNRGRQQLRRSHQIAAWLRPSTDSIQLPDRGRFPSAANYYATALHELGHWTGHETRLKRDLSHPYGSEGYAREELRAEIASLIILAGFKWSLTHREYADFGIGLMARSAVTHYGGNKCIWRFRMKID
jgi:hypothetical protein